MLAKVTSCAVVGLDGAIVEVEVDTSRGLPSLTIVGLPDTAVQESRERVRAAIKNSGLIYPNKRLTVNLAPADLRKEGPAYDLPIAVGILLASEQAWPDRVENALFVGELSLDGGVRHTTGILQGLEVIPVTDLSSLVTHLQGLRSIEPYRYDLDLGADEPPLYAVDFSHVKGQEHVKRA